MKNSKAHLYIDGMHCGSCSAKVESKVSSLAGVALAQVSLPLNRLTVEFDPLRLSSSQVAEAVEKIGYKVTKIQEIDTGSVTEGAAVGQGAGAGAGAGVAHILTPALENEATDGQKNAVSVHLIFAIEGMHCASCAAKVEGAIGEVEGVVRAQVSSPMETATVEALGSEKNNLEEEIIASVKKKGYGAKLLSKSVALGEVLSGAQCEVLGGAPCGADGEGGEDSFLNSVSIWTAQANKDAMVLRVMRRELWPAAIAAFLLVVINMGFMLLLQVGVSLPAFLEADKNPLGLALLQAALFLPCLWAARNIYFNGIKRIYYLAPNMNTLVFLGSSAAAAYSFWNIVSIYLGSPGLVHDLYFEAAGVILTLVLLGKYFELKARKKAGDAIFKLLDMAPERAILLENEENGEQREVLVKDIKEGDLLVVLPGARLPVDGTVIRGDSWVDEALVTGESLPVNKEAGSSVIGGSINGTGVMIMRAERVGGAMVLARIIKMVGEAQGSKAPISSLADKISLYFVPAVLVLAVGAGLLWYFVGGESFTFALRISITVLVIACPCAMGLATPISIMVGTGRGAQKGVLVRSGGALQAAAEINTLIFDKTGTLTSSNIECTNIIPLDEAGVFLDKSILDAGEVVEGKEGTRNAEGMEGMEDKLLRFAASLEAWSEHPLAAAMVEHARARKLNLLPVENFSYTVGKGVKGDIVVAAGSSSHSGSGEGVKTKIDAGIDTEIGARVEGGHALPLLPTVHIELLGADYGLTLARGPTAETMAAALKFLEGSTALLMLVNNVPAALFGFAAPVRAEGKRVVEEVIKMGITPVMLTGDRQSAAQRAAVELGITEVYAEVMPEDKAEFIKGVVAKNGRAGMVGDGVNDAPALALAHVGIAMSSGTDVAMEAGDIVLMKEGLDGVVEALKLSRAVMRNIRQNLFWAFAYNVVCIPVAAGVLYIFGGPTLSPMFAGLAMALSSVSVVFNALRLRRA